MKQLLRYIFVLAAVLMVAVGDVWADACAYSLENTASRVNVVQTGSAGLIKYHNFPNTTLCTLTNSYGISKISFDMKKDGGTNNGDFKLQFYNGSSWEDAKDSSGNSITWNVKNSNTTTVSKQIDPNTATGKATKFQIVRTNNTNFTSSSRYFTISNIVVVMAKTMSGSEETMVFDPQIYNTTSTAKTREFTFSNVETGKSIDITSNTNAAEFPAEVSKSGDCTGSVTVSVKFKPSQKGIRTGQITVSGDCGSKTFSVTGNGLLATPTLTLTGVSGLVDRTADIANPNNINLSQYIDTYIGDGYNYEVVSSNSQYAHFDGDNFYATEKGEYTIHISSPAGDHYSDTFADGEKYRVLVVTVRDKARPAYAANYAQSTADGMLVDGVIENAYTLTNVSKDSYFDCNISVISISDVNDGSGLVISYDMANNKIVAHNAGTATLQFVQTENNDYYGSASPIYTFTVSKHQTVFGGEAYSMMVEGTQIANYSYTNTSSAQPSSLSTDAFYYTIDNVVFANEALNNGTDLVTFNPSTKQITAYNAGTAKITLHQKETYKYSGATASYDVSVNKHTPEFTLNPAITNSPEKLYLNELYPDYFTINANSPMTMISSDTLVAKWVPGSNGPQDEAPGQSYTLKTLSKTNIATLTAILHETYYWQRWEGSVDIQLKKEDNHVQIDLTADNYRSLITSSHYGLTWYNGGVHIGDASGGGFNWDDKYVVIEFTGIPNRLSFNAVGTGGATDEYYYIQQGTSKDNLSSTKLSESESKNWDVDVALDPTTRCVKLCYSGNFAATFRNVRITERKEFYVTKVDSVVPITKLNFNKDANGDDKKNQVNAPYSLSFDFHYANIGHDVKLSTNDPAHFTISQTSFKDLGGEQVGKRTITVTYSSPTEYTAENKKLYITDELGNKDSIALTASTVKATPTLTWQGVYAAEKPVLRISEGAVSGLATASSGLQVTYRSSDESIIKVSEDSLSLIPLQVAEAVEITAVQKGNNVWNEVKKMKTFRVTDKKTQLIHWPNTLSDLVIGGDDVALDAKVYIVDDITGEYTYNAERTAHLQYAVENTNVVDIEDGLLKIKSVGETYLTVTSPGDAQYAEASIKEYVRVRTALAGCEDNLLHTSYTDSELEYFQMNLGAIQHGPFNIDRSIGEPDYITLQHHGVAWAASFGGTFEVYYETTSSAELQYAGSFSPTKNQTNVATIDLPREATKFYIKRSYGGTGYHYISNIKVHPDQFVETNVTDIDFGNIYLGSQVSQTFTVNYCNIKSEIYPQTFSSDVQVSPVSFGECNGYGSQSITVTWTPSAVSKKEQTVTIADPVSGKSASVRIFANVLKGTQTLNWVAPSPIKACGELPLPEETNEHIALEWAVVAGDAYADFEDGYLALKGNGTITLRASNQGSENYNEFQKDYQITIVYNPIFLGTVDSVWTNPANWNICHVPTAAELQGRILEIQAPVALTEELSVAGIVLQNNATIHIADTAGLSIGAQGIRGTNNDGTSIIIDNTPSSAGYFRMDSTAQYKPAKATVNYTTKTYDQGYPRYEVWQYIGMPGENAHMEGLNSEVSIYNWDETCGWLKQDYTPETNIPAWTGYAFTQSQEENATFTIKAEPIFAGKEISFTCTASGMRGDNLLVNSYLAPIDITKIEPEDVIDPQNKLTKTFFFFNAGSWSDWKDGAGDITANGYDQSSAGHYYSVPFYSSRLMKSGDTQLVIPSMQGVYVYTEAPSSIKLNYTKHVYGADAANNLNQPMRAPEQKLSDNFRRVCIQAISENSGADRMYVIQDESTTPDYDNGYDGDNIMASGQVNIYTSEHFGQMEVSCSNDIDSMYIGFTAGEDSEYMLNFSAVVGDDLYLYDTDADLLLPLIDGEQYAFYAAPNSVNNSRFLIIKKSTSNPDDGQGGVATDVENLPTGQNLCIHNKIVYVSEAPANSSLSVYATNGALLAGPYTINHAPYTLKLDLPAGVYMLRLNNHVYKFVCQ